MTPHPERESMTLEEATEFFEDRQEVMNNLEEIQSAEAMDISGGQVRLYYRPTPLSKVITITCELGWY